MFEFKSLINSNFKFRVSISSVEHSNFDLKDNDDLVSLRISDDHISTISMKTLNDKQNKFEEDENIELLDLNSLRKILSLSILSSIMNHDNDIVVRQLLIVYRVTKSLTNQLRKDLKLI